MSNCETKPLPLKVSLDEPSAGPFWWERVLWGIGGGVVGAAISLGLLGMMEVVTQRYETQRGWGLLGVLIILLWSIPIAGVFGLIIGAIWTGRTGFFAILGVHSVFALLLAAGCEPTFAILARFFLGAAFVLAAIAFAIQVVAARWGSASALDDFRESTLQCKPNVDKAR